MTIEQYLTDRVEDQYKYYSRASARAKRSFRMIKFVEIGLAAIIPFLSALITPNSAHEMKLLVGAIGVLITILSGSLLLFKFQELWVTYRSTAQALKTEQYLFLRKAGPYGVAGSEAIFVERIEALLNEESKTWRQFSITRDGSGNVPIESEGEKQEEEPGAEPKHEAPSEAPPHQ